MSLDEWLDECTMRWLERENDRVRERNGEGDELQWWERFDSEGAGGMDEEQRRGLGRGIEACTQRWLSSVGVSGGSLRLESRSLRAEADEVEQVD